MAKGGVTGGGRRRSARGTRPTAKTPAKKQAKTPAKAPARTPRTPKRDEPGAEPRATASVPRVFRLGAIPGATPGKWTRIWRERMPEVELVLTPLEVRDQRAALLAGDVDAALVRLPLDSDGLHVIPLYDEVAVVVVPADSALTVADDLDADDLEGETLIVPADNVLSLTLPQTIPPAFAPPADTGEAIATVAAGVGVVIVPMSLARLHHRKDVAYRPLRGAPVSTVALAWPADRTTDDVETFIGIVRGRTSNSSR